MAKQRDYKAEYKRRIEKGLRSGFSRSQAAGHPKESEKSISGVQKERKALTKVKLKLYSYKSYIVWNEGEGRTEYGEGDSHVLAMVTGDINRKSKYNENKLFELHQFFEDATDDYFRHRDMYVEKEEAFNLYVDNDYTPLHKQGTAREFIFQILRNNNREYFIKYSKGQTIKKQMWEGFDIVGFRNLIRLLKDWE